MNSLREARHAARPERPTDRNRNVLSSNAALRPGSTNLAPVPPWRESAAVPCRFGHGWLQRVREGFALGRSSARGQSARGLAHSKTWRQDAPSIESASLHGAHRHPRPILAALSLLLFLLVPAAWAYPPAPDHTFYGMVRNEWGDPINISGARVFITSTNGASARAPVAASIDSGVNYRLIVPMDSARSLKTDLTSGGSLRQNQPFQLKVQIGTITYLPIEMVLSRPIGDPAGTSRLNLTLGVDSDGDGLPDAWEIAMGLNPNDPNDAGRDSDGDGLSNEEEYRAGTYAFDPNDGFRLSLVGADAGQSQLEFLVIPGRTYTVYSSPDFLQWSPVSFRVVSGGVPGALQGNYSATAVRQLRIEVPPQAGTTNRYFKAMVQ